MHCVTLHFRLRAVLPLKSHFPIVLGAFKCKLALQPYSIGTGAGAERRMLRARQHQFFAPRILWISSISVDFCDLQQDCTVAADILCALGYLVRLPVARLRCQPELAALPCLCYGRSLQTQAM